MHIAPGHGNDDFELGQANGLPVPDTVSADGVYLSNVPLFAGRSIYRPNGKPGDAITAANELVEHLRPADRVIVAPFALGTAAGEAVACARHNKAAAEIIPSSSTPEF